jgi:hypothetical protein
VDVADPDGRSARAKAGQIWAMFATKEQAEKWAEEKAAEGLDAIVVEAQEVTK